MAEVLIGPLVSLAVYLGGWIKKRRKQREINREYISEATALVNAVNSLANLVQGKVDTLQQYTYRNGFPPDSFDALIAEIWQSYYEAQDILEIQRLSPEIKRLRIEGIHNRLTQSLTAHLGFLIIERLSENTHFPQSSSQGFQSADNQWNGEYLDEFGNFQQAFYPDQYLPDANVNWNSFGTWESGPHSSNPAPPPYSYSPPERMSIAPISNTQRARPNKLIRRQRSRSDQSNDMSRTVSDMTLGSCDQPQNVDRINSEDKSNLNIDPAIKGVEMTAGMLFYMVIGLIVIIGMLGV